MTEVIKTLSIDLARKCNNRIVFAVQNDFASRKLKFVITNDGAHCPIEAGATATVGILRPDGESAAYYAEIGEDGSVSFTIPLWALSVVGEVKCNLIIFDGVGNRISSSGFSLEVEEVSYLGDDISDDDSYPLLLSLMNEIGEIKTAEADREANELTRTVNEQTREENEALREKAEAERANAEFARESAENSRQANEALRESAESARLSAEAQREQNEIERNNMMSDKLSELEEAYGKKGEVTLLVAEFTTLNNQITQSVTISGMREHDLVSFTPASRSDKERAENAGLFVIPNCQGEIVEFSAKKLPDGDINLIYFITRGAE